MKREGPKPGQIVGEKEVGSVCERVPIIFGFVK